MFELFTRKNKSKATPESELEKAQEQTAERKEWAEKKIKELEYLEQDKEGKLTPYGIAHEDLKVELIRKARLAVERGEVRSIEEWIEKDNERIEKRKKERI